VGRASRAKRTRREEAARDALRRQIRNKCLVCGTTAGSFTSREHPFPESLGNTEIVLPPGVICDCCNNGPLSRLDQTICEFLPIQMRRTMLGVTSKAGLIPRTRFSTGVIENLGPASLRFTAAGNRAMLS
jgi:hypothetical protein